MCCNKHLQAQKYYLCALFLVKRLLNQRSSPVKVGLNQPDWNLKLLNLFRIRPFALTKVTSGPDFNPALTDPN